MLSGNTWAPQPDFLHLQRSWRRLVHITRTVVSEKSSDSGISSSISTDMFDWTLPSITESSSMSDPLYELCELGTYDDWDWEGTGRELGISKLSESNISGESSN